MFMRIWNYTKKHKRNVIILVGIIVVILFFVFKPSQSVPVREYEVKKIEVIKNINASGETKPDRNNVIKNPISAKIKKINFTSGSPVKKDDVVIELDELSANSALASAWQSYLSAKSTTETYDQQIQAAEAAENDKKFLRDRAQSEYNGDDSPTNKQALKTAESAYQTAVSNLNSLKDKKDSVLQSSSSTYAAYMLARDNYTNTKLKAPADGFVALQDLKVGDILLVGQELFSITNSSELRFIAEVDEADIQKIVLNQPATVELEGYTDKRFEGLVSSVDAKTTLTKSGSNIVETFISVDFNEVKPIIGLTGTAKIQVGKESQQLAVPFDSVIFEDNDIEFVFVIKNNMAYKTKVEVGFEGDEYYVIKSGLNEGDKVVTGVDITTIKDGQQISLIKN